MPKRDERVHELIESAGQASFYVVQELGPTAFVLRPQDEEKKIRVALGSIQSCNCAKHLLDHQICLHIVRKHEFMVLVVGHAETLSRSTRLGVAESQIAE